MVSTSKQLDFVDKIHSAAKQTRKDAAKSVVRSLLGRRTPKNRNRSAQTHRIARQQNDKLS
jgi:hypothetical protein